ncbi:hypothetical protein [Pseudomonas sp. NPDC099000]|uniref:hypothetical protein n=1 Tax=Pseudomonas sp. NPDC099000 TaxID=3364488 RepID=UPI00383BD2DC
MKYVPVNSPNLIELLHKEFCNDKKEGLIDLDLVRNHVSSPRFGDTYVREMVIGNLLFVGDSFLDQRTRLADNRQKTFGISQKMFSLVKPEIDEIESYEPMDSSISILQVWTVDPSTLNEHQLRLAVSLSYTAKELRAESRIVGALNHILEDIGFYLDGDRY